MLLSLFEKSEVAFPSVESFRIISLGRLLFCQEISGLVSTAYLSLLILYLCFTITVFPIQLLHLWLRFICFINILLEVLQFLRFVLLFFNRWQTYLLIGLQSESESHLRIYRCSPKLITSFFKKIEIVQGNK